MSRDRITLDLDEDGLRLLLRLLGADTVSDAGGVSGGAGAAASAAMKDYRHIQQKLHDVFGSISVRGGRAQGVDLPLGDITVRAPSRFFFRVILECRITEVFSEILRGNLAHITFV